MLVRSYDSTSNFFLALFLEPEPVSTSGVRLPEQNLFQWRYGTGSVRVINLLVIITCDLRDAGLLERHWRSSATLTGGKQVGTVAAYDPRAGGGYDFAVAASGAYRNCLAHQSPAVRGKCSLS